MKLSSLIKGCDLKKTANPVLESGKDIDILAISSRAQDIEPGGLFLAIKGNSADGHDYIDQAIENGAVAVIAQEKPPKSDIPGSVTLILVEDSRNAIAIVAANFYGWPSRNLTLVGITGTNGKTTTTWILESIFNACGFNCGVIGTVNIRYKGKTFDNPVTTPDAIELQKALFNMQEAGITHVIMEVSSHGLSQFRVDTCEFDAGVYTNLTQDHLDYHGSMEDYFGCKKRFFTDFLGPKSRTGSAPAIINIDDAKGKVLADTISYKKITISHRQPADVTAVDIMDDINGLSGTICLPGGQFSLKTSLTGRFNLENILCAAGAAHAIGIGTEKIQQGIESLTRVPGRLEKINNPLNRYLFVDYAHTPDALESILSILAQRAPERVITVFGCGGDRDRTKRPLMGKIACKYSDVAIVTSDNPRSESPEA
ncbi:MAG: UDP-N-acetylmuramoyl-L-alanyl-D-glutamate--2,6-diaminopimelate ligase, partial [Proteobacteria bacterium]|nr:UDP-N-acetylmuramoyl-L-alanyl-D-glutamate--2,6-diaminopimelate ligase [Pseudomonadota bacterium]